MLDGIVTRALRGGPGAREASHHNHNEEIAAL